MGAAENKNVVLALTGGSGAIVTKGLAEALVRMGMSLYFVCSRYGRLMWQEEMGEPLDAAVAELGVLGLIELTSLMGCYSLLSFHINAFGVELPEDLTEKVLPI